ncbi:MAG: FIST N-terminal domain-containing protein [Syntrophales bacterium]|nr:FIST N-terminal domain-containing protein [Syntrophales bacterium]
MKLSYIRQKLQLSSIQKVVIGIIVVALIGAGTWAVYTTTEKGTLPIIPQIEGSDEETKKVQVGYGWSVKNEESEAVEEAVSSVKAQLGDNTPEFALLFSTVGYDPAEILNEVRKCLPNTSIYGGTSCLSVQTADGLHVGEVGSLALLAVSSQNITFGVGGADIEDFTSAREAGKAAVQAAIEATGKDGLPKLVLMTAAPGEEEELLLGINDIIGNDIPVIGGSSGDNDITGQWRQFANDNVYSNGISLTAIYTDLKIGWAFEAGYLRTENRGEVTRAEGRVIYEIDGRPAAEVYNEWTGGLVSEELDNGGSVLSKTTIYPLAKVINGEEEEYSLSIHPLSINATDHSLSVFANVEDGDELMLMHGDWELLLNRALTTPSKALESNNISEDDVVFGIYTFCAGTMLSIPEDEMPKMPSLVGSVIGDAPFIGTFTFGEQGYIVGVGNCHGNLVNSMIVFTDNHEGD